MTTIRIELAPDWRITSAGLGYALEYRDPVMLRWHTRYVAPTVALCERAYALFEEDDVPRAWEEMDG